MPNTLIRNGTVVTARETQRGRRADRRRADQGSARGNSAERRDKMIDATGMYVMPGGIDAHTHLDMPFGGTTSSDDFETGTRAAAFGGTTTMVDFAIQARGTQDARCARHLVEEGRRQGLHRLRPAHDRHRPGHVGPGRHGRHGARRRGQLQAVHGLSERADGGRRHHFQGAVADREERRADLHARRERQRDRRDRREGAGRGQDRADLSRADAADARRGGGGASRDRDGGDCGRAGVHRASVVGGCAESGARGARSRRSRRLPRPARSICCSRSKNWSGRISKARSTCSRRRCATKKICRSCGTG